MSSNTPNNTDGVKGLSDSHPAEKFAVPTEATKSSLQDTLSLSDQAQERLEAFNRWSQQKPELAKNLK